MCAISCRIVSRAALVAGVGDLAAEHVVLAERHAAGVLHRAGVELGDEQLVVLVEGVAHAEVGVVPVEALLGDLEQLVGVEVLGQRLAAPQAEVDAVVVVA